MTKAEFKERIRGLAFEVIKDRKKAEIAAVRRDEALTKKFEANNQHLINTLLALFKGGENPPNKNKVNPPIPTVEKDSCAGGRQE